MIVGETGEHSSGEAVAGTVKFSGILESARASEGNRAEACLLLPDRERVKEQGLCV